MVSMIERAEKIAEWLREQKKGDLVVKLCSLAEEFQRKKSLSVSHLEKVASCLRACAKEPAILRECIALMDDIFEKIPHQYKTTAVAVYVEAVYWYDLEKTYETIVRYHYIPGAGKVARDLFLRLHLETLQQTHLLIPFAKYFLENYAEYEKEFKSVAAHCLVDIAINMAKIDRQLADECFCKALETFRKNAYGTIHLKKVCDIVCTLWSYHENEEWMKQLIMVAEQVCPGDVVMWMLREMDYLVKREAPQLKRLIRILNVWHKLGREGG